jgi:alkyl hydroperoxide reductase subunit AhpC
MESWNFYLYQVVACSVDSHFTHLAWMNTPRSEGGLGRLDIPLLSDLTHTISKVLSSVTDRVSDPYSFFTDPNPDPEDPDGVQYGSGYGSG